MTDLLPCPFCGEAVSFYRDSQTGGQQVGRTKAGILCQRCGTTHFYGSDASHIRTCARWNTRPIEDRLRRELREAEEAIRATPFMLDVSGWPMERGAMEWMMLPAVRRARGREGEPKGGGK